MRYLLPNSSLKFVLAATCLGCTLAQGADVVITDATRVTGAGAISPSDSALEVSFNATGSTAESTLEGLSGFGAVQTFAGFTGNQSTTNDYILSFSDSELPDVRYTYTGSISTTSAVSLANNGFSTSTSQAMRLQALSNAGNFTMRIDLGDFTGGTFTTGATGVEAVGFTLTGRFYALDGDGVTVTYLDTSGGVLSTQVLAQLGGASAIAGYTGFQSVGNLIGAIEIDFTGAGGDTPVFGLDDFGFTVAIPETGTSALMLGCAAMATLALRRR